MGKKEEQGYVPKVYYGWGPPLSHLPTVQLGQENKHGVCDPTAIVTILKTVGPISFQSTGPATEMQIQEEEEFRG